MKKKLILASQSPRRRELLELIGLPFEVQIPTFEEHTAQSISVPGDLALANARGKAEEVARSHPESVILGVDTVVSIGGEILGKPENGEDAVRMLSLLQGKTHTVWTALCFINNETTELAIEHTEVDFLPMNEEEIQAYVDTGEPMDKAGAYAIQGKGAVYIRGIRGDFFTVMGLPVWRVWEWWKKQ